MPDIDMGREGNDKLAQDPTNMGRTGKDGRSPVSMTDRINEIRKRVAEAKAAKVAAEKKKKEELARQKKQKTIRIAKESEDLYQSMREKVHGVVVEQQGRRAAALQNKE